MEKLPKIAKFLDLNLEDLEKGKKVNRKHLINALNYINFQDRTVLLKFKHLKYDTALSLEVRPQPCLDDSLTCRWIETTGLDQSLKSYQIQYLLLTNGQRLLLATPEMKRISAEGISLTLPESCYDLNARKARRFLCEGIQVDFNQNSVTFHGALLDFSAISFCVEVSSVPPQSFQWINPESSVIVTFRNEQGILYSGECRIVRQTLGQQTKIFALEPMNTQMRRFKPKMYRTSRHKLSPSPSIFFKHPITRKMIILEVEDLSGAGFSVKENRDNSVLLPGMIIPHLEIEIAVGFRIACKGQVVYRNLSSSDADETSVKCGVAFLDMDMQEQVRLSSLLHRLIDKKSYVCSRVDLDDLWKLFFDAGFVYPEKYASIHLAKEKFKETYEKLYLHNPHIARHFIYQDKGIIHGHMAMVRFYENTWLIHHHASSKTSIRAGLAVLDQVGSYINNFYALYSTHMDFVICYYRPENRFPNHVFGGCVREINDPKGCCLDSLAYFHFPVTFYPDFSGTGFLLARSQPEDLIELKSFYEHESGGLMLYALDMEPDMIYSDNLSREYQKIGFMRERHIFSLKKDGDIKAVIMVDVSDIGLNLSNLTSCIHVFVLDSYNLQRSTLYSALFTLSKYYEQEEIPVLLFPVSYAERQSIPYEKIYNLWVLNVPHSGERYLRYVDNSVRHPNHE